ncbi:nicotinate-nicotinamide nucleotide adenylyltransferase [Clostridium estertheticum]|uniref:nicotinate-nicotinamide nucleotide adenylyltransferase n=1 Tax=Clostridium estertheticum TaxID=238834 RepID=UPI001C0D7AC8|nr:nicotinate-nicotinamide nucleotide adenylyltransferase [Clostridium estertheticum]MBU3216514.1 nicotinate-nicotinamide nucleotide adenylyltransferase [Clostridium estertheticum]WAG54458.1 nicotinate-nicotinamide nucleotide adenylyltransferase [Clostridium estertheticum]
MLRKLVIITGTFNPVTKAHIKLALLAIEVIQGATVIYVPAKDAFLKSWKHMEDDDILSERERIDMLSMAVEPYGFFYDTCEINVTVPGDTYNTLHYLAKKYEADITEVYYIFGSDKLTELKKWYKSDLLLREFKFLVVRRTHDEVEAIINKDKFLSNSKEHFKILHGEEFFRDISATRVRQAIREGKFSEIRELVPKEVCYYLESRCQK